MKIAIASDHRGYKLKDYLINELEKEYEVIDLGTNSEESTDYPDYAFMLGEAVISGVADFGVAICGSGIGISIACNKVKGIRCAKVSNSEEAKYTREDNDANIVAFGEKTNNKEALELLRFAKKPLLVPSSNKADQKPALCDEEVKTIFGNEISVIIPGKAIGGQASTIIDLTGEEVKLIRKGPIPLEELNLLIDN